MSDGGISAEYDYVYPGLTVGKELAPGVVPRLGYHVAVRCLRGDPQDGTEHVVHAPLTDDAFEIVKGDWGRACSAALAVVHHIKAGRRCYVYCREGLNRSALVAALAVRDLMGCTGAEAVEEVRVHRAGSLYNWHFRAALESLGPPDGNLENLEQPMVRR